MCYKVSDITLPCGRNDTLILREWALNIRHKDQSILLYANQSMLVTEKILRCDNNKDFTMNYEFCREKLFMLEILFYSPNKPSLVLPNITVQSRVIIGPRYPALSLHDMESMKIQMVGCKTCKVTAHQMYLDFLDRVILIANNNNNKNKDENSKEEPSSSPGVHNVDLNILLPTLFGSLTTVTVAVIGLDQYRRKRGKQLKATPEKQTENGVANSENGATVTDEQIPMVHVPSTSKTN
ncbi:uncharacterized protein [Mytilus edulis]|uniref:uncharacterized protein n=1 Tax=Mytilus edulis TaxID=6550 RepID=UPI0039EF7861